VAIGRNFLAGLANSVWSALIGLAVVPFYLKYLGIEAYGLIGFYATSQVLLQLLDMGMAPTINREVARCAAAGDIGESGKLLHSLGVIYFGIAAAIATLIFMLAPLIAEHWLESTHIPPQTISNVVMLMGVVLACRWPIGLYQGALIGAQRLTVSSAVNMTMVTVGSIGAIGVLAFVSPTIEAFFIWQACVGFVYMLTMRTAAWRVIGTEKAGRFDRSYIRRVLSFSLGAGAIAIAGLVLTQLDKVILSKTIGLENFGKYMLANLVASSLYILIIPIFNIVYPRFSALVAQQKSDELLRQYGLASQVLAALLFPSAMALILVAQPLVGLWTGNEAIANEVAPLATLLLIAYALHGVMHMPYAVMLAAGDTKPMLSIYLVLILIMVPLTMILSTRYGAMGGGAAQLSLFVLYLFVGTWVTHKRHLKGYAQIWLLKDIGLPLALSIVVGGAGYLLIQSLQGGISRKLPIAIILWLLVTLSSVASSQHSRSTITGYWRLLRSK